MNVYTKLATVDSLRNFFLSALVPIVDVLLMLMFIHQLNASTWEKTLLGTLLKSSFLLSLPLSIWIFRKKFLLPHVLVVINVLGILGLILSIIITQTYLFLLIVLLITFPLDGIHPLLAEFYSRYPSATRGRRFAFSGSALAVGSIAFAYLFRDILKQVDTLVNKPLPASSSNNPFYELYQNSLYTLSDFLGNGYALIILLVIISLAIATYFSQRLPKLRTRALELRLREVGTVLKEDKLFRMILIAWMFLGVANLWLFPYRTNYLSEEYFGFNYSKERVIFLLVVLPICVQLLMIMPVSYLFDKMNFLKLRITFNVILVIHMLLFFWGDSYSYIFASMVFYGVGRTGGNLAWKLWINQMVPTEKAGTYMAIHSGFTGLRMVVSPFFGLWALNAWGGKICGSISAFLMIISISLLVPLIKVALPLKKY